MPRPPAPDTLPDALPPDIGVSVQVRHRPDYSTPDRYAFSYVITIENRSDQTWQLLARHWDIQDAQGRAFSVDGEGVVGEQPILAPGASYTYDSFVTVEALPGLMHGHYVMGDAWGARAQVPIAPFRLDVGERVLN